MALFHKHDWEVIERAETPVMEYTPWGMLKVGKKLSIVERCTKCGKIRTQKVKI